MKEIVHLRGLSGPPFTDGATFKKFGTADSSCINIGVVKRNPNFSSYREGQLWGYIEDPQLPEGAEFKFEKCDKAGYAKVVIVSESGCASSGSSVKGGNMQGSVYEGVVVRTTQVPAGEGLTSSVPKSEIVLTVPAFLAKDDATAQATVMAKAVEAGHKLDDPVVVVEVKVRKYA